LTMECCNGFVGGFTDDWQNGMEWETSDEGVNCGHHGGVFSGSND
jgi:hypothetical protein